jgi:hypothetical protein
MLKAITRAALLTLILILIVWALLFHTVITIIVFSIVVVFGWLTFVLYMDPPDEWN